MEPPLHLRPLLFFYANTAITLLAANMSRYSVILFTRSTSGSDSFTGFVFAVSFIPTLLFGPYAGVVADRYDRRRTVVFSQLLITAAVIVFALGFDSPDTLYWQGFSVIYAFLIGAAVTFMIPARFALLGNLVPPKDIVKSTSVVQLIVLAGFGLAPFATGIMKTEMSWRTFFFASAAFYFLGILFLLPVKTSFPSLHFREKTTLLEGLRFVLRTRSVRDLLILACIGIFLLGPVQVVLPFYAKSHYDLSESGRGAFISLLGLGLLIGGLSVRLLPVPRKRGYASALGAMISGLAALTLVLTSDPFVGGFMLLSAGISGGTLATLISSGLQSHTPDNFRGRVMSLYSIATQLIPAISGFIVAQISHFLGPIAAFFFAGSFVALAAVSALHLPGIRTEGAGPGARRPRGSLPADSGSP